MLPSLNKGFVVVVVVVVVVAVRVDVVVVLFRLLSYGCFF